MLFALLLPFCASADESQQAPDEATPPSTDNAPLAPEPGAEGDGEGGPDSAEGSPDHAEAEAAETAADPTEKLEVKGEASAIDQETYQVLSGDVKPSESKVPVWKRMLAPTEYNFYWNQGIRFERNDGYFRFKGGFRFEFDVASIHGDEAIEETIGGLGVFWDVRRAWLTASGTLGRRLIYAFQVDVTGKSAGDDDRDPYIRELFIGATGLGPLGTVRFGYHKEPFSFSELNSSKNLSFMERSLLAVFAPGYDPGISSQVMLFDGRANLTYGAFYYTGAEGKAANRLDVTARLTGLPIYEDEGRKLLHLGGSYTHQFREDFVLRYRRRPESHLAKRFVDTGDFAADDIDLFTVETIVRHGPFSLVSEGAVSRVQQPSAPSATFWGASAEVSYFLTGEQRPYHRTQGTLGYVIPTNSFNLKKRHWGAWEVAARYSYLTLNSAGIRGGILSDVSVGLNWFIRPHLRLMANYIHAHLNGVGNANIIQFRIGLEY